MSWHREFWGWPAGSASHCLHPLPAEWLTEGEMLFATLHFWKKNGTRRIRIEWTTFQLKLHTVQKFLLKCQSAGLAMDAGRAEKPLTCLQLLEIVESAQCIFITFSRQGCSGRKGSRACACTCATAKLSSSSA